MSPPALGCLPPSAVHGGGVAAAFESLCHGCCCRSTVCCCCHRPFRGMEPPHPRPFRLSTAPQLCPCWWRHGGAVLSRPPKGSKARNSLVGVLKFNCPPYPCISPPPLWMPDFSYGRPFLCQTWIYSDPQEQENTGNFVVTTSSLSVKRTFLFQFPRWYHFQNSTVSLAMENGGNSWPALTDRCVWSVWSKKGSMKVVVPSGRKK